jgi:hypothetical protein
MNPYNKFFLPVLLAFFHPSAEACLHFTESFTGKLKEGTKSVFLFHDGENAHMLVKTEISSESGQLPPEIAWVLPLPGLPSKYEEVDPGVFDELSSITVQSISSKGARGGSVERLKSASDTLKVHSTIVAGNYQIEPIEILQDGAAKPFNAWLKTRHFNPMPEKNQKYYLKKGAVFLAIRAKVHETSISFKPLHIVYKANHLSYPLKFTHDSRTFDLTLYIMKKDRKETHQLPYLTRMGSGQLTSSSGAPHLKSLMGTMKEGFITMYQGRGLNGPRAKLADLKEDPKIDIK